MATMFTSSMPTTSVMFLFGLVVTVVLSIPAGVESSVGVCYGMMGNNLPSHNDVVSLYKANNINRMRLYDPNQGALQALRGSNIQLILGVPNSQLQDFAQNPASATNWVQQNVLNFYPSVNIKYIAVGNEVSPVRDGALAQFVLPAMQHVYQAVRAANLHDHIKVSTAIDTTLIGVSYPPSAGAFRDDVRGYLDPIIGYMVYANAPMLANIYTYFSYAYNPKDISLPYALFTSPSVVVWDGNKGYQNLFDAMLDGLYSALERAWGGSLEVVVSESGWPSEGGFGCSPQNAGTYYSKLIEHVKNGTPKRPGKEIETYLFALFDENQKNPEYEKHFGVFYPNKQPKFNLRFGAARVLQTNTTSVTTPLKSDM